MTRYARPIAITLAAAWAIWGALSHVPLWAWDTEVAGEVSRKMAAESCDQLLINAGAEQVHSWPETLRWWHGTWIGQVPFWRPLTSYAFWLEYRIFTPDRLDRWAALSTILHLLVLCLIAPLVSRFTGVWWLGLVTIAAFAPPPISLTPLGIDMGPAYRGVTLTLLIPVSQEELWLALPLLGAMLASLGRRWALALALAGMAVCFKESGWLAFPLCLLTVLGRDGWAGVRRVPRWVWGTAAVLTVVLLAARYSAGPEVFQGYRMGRNANWETRLWGLLSGVWLGTLSWGVWAPALPAACAFAAWVPWRRARGHHLAIGLAAGFGAATWVRVATQGLAWDVALVELLSVPPHPTIAFLGFASLWVGLAYFTIPHLRRQRLALLAAMVLTTLPYVAAGQVQPHALYVRSIFLAAMAATAALALEQHIRWRFRPGEELATEHMEDTENGGSDS